MKRYIVPLLLACLAGCSDSTTSSPADEPVSPATAPVVVAEPDTAREPDAAPETNAPPDTTPPTEAAVFDKPQLIYYRINKH